MRHRVAKSSFGRSTKHRGAMLKNLVRGLFEQGEIEVTQAKGKEVKRWADKLLHKAQQNTLEARRELHQYFGKRDIVNTLVEKIAPTMSDRTSGFTTLQILGKRRGDNALMVRLALVKKPAEMGSFANQEEKNQEKKTSKKKAK